MPLIRAAAPLRLPCTRVAVLRERAMTVATAAAARRNSQPLPPLAEDVHEAGPAMVDEAQAQGSRQGDQGPDETGRHTPTTGPKSSSFLSGTTLPSLVSAGRVLTCRTITLPAEVSHTKEEIWPG